VPYNGSGLFVRGFNWVQDKLNGIDITASRMDGDSNDFAGGLSNCVTRDGQGKMTATFSPGTDATYDTGAPSARWNNGYWSGTVSTGSVLESTRILKTTAEGRTSTSPAADSTLVLIPQSGVSYEIEARLAFTASNSSAASAGLRVGLFDTNINFNSALISAWGYVNAATFTGITGSFAAGPTNAPSYSISTIAANGQGGNWIMLKATMNVLNLLGSPQIGINWCQNSAAGGVLTLETGSYLTMRRLS